MSLGSLKIIYFKKYFTSSLDRRMEKYHYKRTESFSQLGQLLVRDNLRATHSCPHHEFINVSKYPNIKSLLNHIDT